MSPHQTARKFQATRRVNGRVSVALSLGLPVAPIVLKPATIPTSKGKTQNHKGENMSRESSNEYLGLRLMNGFDYENQAWVVDGKFAACGHPANMRCGCYGREHAGELTVAPVSPSQEFVFHAGLNQVK